MLICRTWTPCFRIRSASISVSMSPSTTATPPFPSKRARRASISVVFPEPGEEMRLSAKIFRSERRARIAAAASSADCRIARSTHDLNLADTLGMMRLRETLPEMILRQGLAQPHHPERVRQIQVVEGPGGRAAPGQFVGGHPHDRPRRERGVDGVDEDDAFLPLDQVEEGGPGHPAVHELSLIHISEP